MDQDRFDSDSAVAELLLSDAIEDVSPEPSAASRGLPGPLSSISALLHPTISEIAHNRFEAGEYADAAEAAFKAVNVRVKKAYTAAGKEEKDGKPLMLSALSVGQPVIRLGDLSTESGKNVQEGYMHIFAGAIQAIRNPKAHENLSISRERAAQFLVLASLLMSKLDEAGCA